MEENTNNNDYINWLEKNSMLYQADELCKNISSKPGFNVPYAYPQSDEIVNIASVWFTAYPTSTITKQDQNILEALSDKSLWKVFKEIGINGMHTGPLKKAGGVKGYEFTPTIDGWFDRIDYSVDSNFGNDDDYINLVKIAKENGAIIAGDIIPGHTGKGPDFRLAELNYKNYPGLYFMVEINESDWDLLPDVEKGQDSANLSFDIADKLCEKGYLPGRLQRVLFSVPGESKKSGWDATDTILCCDNIKRRWVYLHYFKPGQPTLNWIDPTFSANKLIFADIIKAINIFGANLLRLDANPFLGIEANPKSNKTWSESHPLAVVSSNLLAFFIRKLGGWSFQELNVGFDKIEEFLRLGPDLSYDFITRPAYNHAILTQDASFLRLTLRLMQEYKIDPKKLIHAMQNHDEITYELVHLNDNPDDIYDFCGNKITAKDLRNTIINQMHSKAINETAPYNKLSGNGLCTTFVGLCATALNINDPYHMSHDQIELVKKGHLLMAIYNAMQPGVFAISGWDLVGALPLLEEDIKDFIKDGDFRWVNRGAYDLMGTNLNIKKSSDGVPKAKSLYGSLAEQLKDPYSFVSQLKKILLIRKKYKIANSKQVKICAVKNKSAVIMVHELCDDHCDDLGFEITALNFGLTKIKEKILLADCNNFKVYNPVIEKNIGDVSYNGELEIELDGFEGKILITSKCNNENTIN